METTVNERISCLIDRLGYKSKRAFAAKIGVSQTSFNDIINGAEPKHSTLLKILKAEPVINAEWLLIGEGEMLKTAYPSVDLHNTNNAESITIPKEAWDMLQRQTQTILSQQATIENLSLKIPDTVVGATIARAGG